MKTYQNHSSRFAVHAWSLMVLSLMVTACSEKMDDAPEGQDPALPIELSASYPTQAATRASMENGFVADDAVGVFIVDYEPSTDESGWIAGTPALKGDRAGNIRFVYDGTKWKANYQLYWKSKSTPADFYGYYPYDQQMSSVTDYIFTVNRRQDTGTEETGNAEGYLKSDLLWAKAEKVMPTTETISLQYRHLMAGICIQLQLGTGFTAEEWRAADKTVQIENTVLGGHVDLSTGVVTVGDGAANAIIPLSYNDTYRAVVFPQTVAADNILVTVTIDGRTYPLKKEAATTWLSGKMHNMTITVNKSSATGDYTL